MRKMSNDHPGEMERRRNECSPNVKRALNRSESNFYTPNCLPTDNSLLLYSTNGDREGIRSLEGIVG